MTIIVNLSALHTLHHHSVALAAFAKIREDYAMDCCGFRFLQTISNYVIVKGQFLISRNTLIEPYKRGAIDTERFFENLLSMYDFLNADHLDFSNKAEELKDCYSRNPKHALLEAAWNAIIDMNEHVAGRFAQIAEQATPENPVYLISNSNPLNVHKILQLFRKHNPDMNFFDPAAIHSEVTDENVNVQIAPNVFLCLSYRHRLFKTAEQNPNPNTTTSLLKNLLQGIPQDKDVQVISQFEGDLLEARRLGVPDAATHRAADYFDAPAHTHQFGS